MSKNITARNYAAQACVGLNDISRHLKNSGHLRDAKATKVIASKIEGSVHFALPDDGVLFDDGLKGIKGEDIRLPYESISVEFFVTPDELNASNPEVIPVTKKCICAYEEHRDGELFIVFVSAYFSGGRWTPTWSGFLMPSRWDRGQHGNNLKVKGILKGVDYGENRPLITGAAFHALPDTGDLIISQHGGKIATDTALHDTSGEVVAVLELCEALSCSNVSESTLNKLDLKKAKSRKKKNKTPIFETKFLVIDVPLRSAASGAGDGERNSPKQHLRRGHVRRLADGRKIWINSCVVGSSSDGYVSKTYGVRSRA